MIFVDGESRLEDSRHRRALELSFHPWWIISIVGTTGANEQIAE
ncbi:unnamed protein product [Ectocarpus sp. 12 AP-2014]